MFQLLRLLTLNERTCEVVSVEHFLVRKVEHVVLNSGFKCSNYNLTKWGLMKSISGFFSPFSFRTMKPPNSVLFRNKETL